MSDTRDREIAELEARILELRSKPAAPEPAPEPEPERDPDGMPAGWAELHEELAAQEREPEPVAEPAVAARELPAFMRQYPEPPPGPVLASGHGVGGHAGLGTGLSN